MVEECTLRWFCWLNELHSIATSIGLVFAVWYFNSRALVLEKIKKSLRIFHYQNVRSLEYSGQGLRRLELSGATLEARMVFLFDALLILHVEGIVIREQGYHYLSMFILLVAWIVLILSVIWIARWYWFDGKPGA